MVIFFVISLTIIVTHLMKDYLRFHPVQSSVITTLLGYGICLIFFKNNLKFYSMLIYGSSFIGMTNFNVNKTIFILVSSTLYWILLKHLIEYVPNVGGVLGFLAFISVLISFGIFKITTKIKG